MDTPDRLQALHAEAARQHVQFEKSKRRRTARSRGINAAIAITALATAAASGAEMPTPATTALAAMLLVTLTLNLFLTNTQHDHDLWMLSDTWRRHRAEAARLLHATRNPAGEDLQRISRDTDALEREISKTSSDSLLYQPHPGPTGPAAREHGERTPHSSDDR